MIASIFISIIVIIFVLVLIYLILNRGKYEAELAVITIFIIYFISEITYFILFNLSAEIFLDIPFALILWYISIITRIFAIGIFAALHNFELNKNSKVRFLTALVYIFLVGVFLSLLFVPDSFTVIQKDFEYF